MSEETRAASRAAHSAYIDAEPGELCDIPVSFVSGFKRGFIAGMEHARRTPPPATADFVATLRFHHPMPMYNILISPTEREEILKEWPSIGDGSDDPAGD